MGIVWSQTVVNKNEPKNVLSQVYFIKCIITVVLRDYWKHHVIHASMFVCTDAFCWNGSSEANAPKCQITTSPNGMNFGNGVVCKKILLKKKEESQKRNNGRRKERNRPCKWEAEKAPSLKGVSKLWMASRRKLFDSSFPPLSRMPFALGHSLCRPYVGILLSTAWMIQLGNFASFL